MATAYRNSSRLANVQTSSPSTIAVPSGTVTGDITLVFISVWNEGSSLSISGGNGTWSKFLTYSYPAAVGTIYVTAWWKRATANDSGTYSLSGWAGSQWIEADAISIGGISTEIANPIEDVDSASAASGTAIPTVSVTTADSDPALILFTDSYDLAAWTPPTNFTEVQDASETTMLAYRLPGTSGTFGTGGTGSQNDTTKSAHLIAVPSSSGPARPYSVQTVTMTMGQV